MRVVRLDQSVQHGLLVRSDGRLVFVVLLDVSVVPLVQLHLRLCHLRPILRLRLVRQR